MEEKEEQSLLFKQAYDTITNREFKNAPLRKERRSRYRKRMSYAETYREMIANDRDLCLTAGKTTVKFTKIRRACSPQNIRSIAKKIASSLFAGPITSTLKKDVGIKSLTVSFNDSEPKKRKVTFEDRSNSPINYVLASVPDPSGDKVNNTPASVLEENRLRLNQKKEVLKIEHQPNVYPSSKNCTTPLESKTHSENDSSSFFSKASAFADRVANGIFSSSLEKPNILASMSTSVDINCEGSTLDNTQLVDITLDNAQTVGTKDDVSNMDTIQITDIHVGKPTFENSQHVDKCAEVPTVENTPLPLVETSKRSDKQATDASTSFHSMTDVSYSIQAKTTTDSKPVVGGISDSADASTTFDENMFDASRATAVSTSVGIKTESKKMMDSISEDPARNISATNGKGCGNKISETPSKKNDGTESSYFSAMSDGCQNMLTSPSDAYRFRNWSSDDTGITPVDGNTTSQYVTAQITCNKHRHSTSAEVTFTETWSNQEPRMLSPRDNHRGSETPVKRVVQKPKPPASEICYSTNGSKKDRKPFSNETNGDRNNRMINQTVRTVTQAAETPIKKSTLMNTEVSIKQSDIAFEGYDSTGDDSLMGVASYPLTATQNSVVCKEIRESKIKKSTNVSKIASEGNNTKTVSLREIKKNQMRVIHESSTDDTDDEHTRTNNVQHSDSQETTEYMELNLIGSIASYAQEFANCTSEDSIAPHEMRKAIKTVPKEEPTCEYSNRSKSPNGNKCTYNTKNKVKEEQDVVYLRSSKSPKGTGLKEASTNISKCYLEKPIQSCQVTLTTDVSTSISKAYVTCSESITNATENKDDLNNWSKSVSNFSSKQTKHISTSTYVSQHESGIQEKQREPEREHIETPTYNVDERRACDSKPSRDESRETVRRNREPRTYGVEVGRTSGSEPIKETLKGNDRSNRKTVPSVADVDTYLNLKASKGHHRERENRNRDILPSLAEREHNKRNREMIAAIINVTRTSDSSMDESNKTSASEHKESGDRCNTNMVPQIPCAREDNTESEINQESELHQESECKQKYNVNPGEMIGYKRLKKIVKHVDKTACLEDTIEELTSSRVVMFDLKRLVDEELQLTGSDGEGIIQTIIGQQKGQEMTYGDASNVQRADSKLSVSSKCSDLAHVIDTYISYASVVNKQQRESNCSDYVYTNDKFHHTHTIYPTKSISSVDFSDGNRRCSEYRYSRQHNLSRQKSLDTIQTSSNTEYGSLTDLKASNIWRHNMRALVNPKRKYTSRRNHIMDLSEDTINDTLSSVRRDIHVVKKILANKCNSNERLYLSNKKRSRSCCYENHRHGNASSQIEGKVTKRTAVHRNDSIVLQLHTDSRSSRELKRQPNATASSAPTYRTEHSRDMKAARQTLNNFESSLDSFLPCEEEPFFVQSCTKGVKHRQARPRAREACVGTMTSTMCLCISPVRGTLGAHALRGDPTIVCNNPNSCIDVCLCDGSHKDIKTFHPFTKSIGDKAINDVTYTIGQSPKGDDSDEIINTNDLQQVIQELESSTEAITNNMQKFLKKEKITIESAAQSSNNTASRTRQSNNEDDSDAKVSIKDLQMFVRHLEAKIGSTKPTNDTAITTNVCSVSAHEKVNITNGTSTKIINLQSSPKDDARSMDSMKQNKTRQHEDDIHDKHSSANIDKKERKVGQRNIENASDYSIRVQDLQNFINEFECSIKNDASSKIIQPYMESYSASERTTDCCDSIPMPGPISEREMSVKSNGLRHSSQHSSSVKGHQRIELKSIKGDTSKSEIKSLSKSAKHTNNKPCHQQAHSQVEHSQTGVREKESAHSCTPELRNFIDEFEGKSENDESARLKMIPMDIQQLLRSILTSHTASKCESTLTSKQQQDDDGEWTTTENLVSSLHTEEINTEMISRSHRPIKEKIHEKDSIQSSLQGNPTTQSEQIKTNNDESSIMSRIRKDLRNSLRLASTIIKKNENKPTTASQKQDDTEFTVSITENETHCLITDSEGCGDQNQTISTPLTNGGRSEGSSWSSQLNNAGTILLLNAETGYFNSETIPLPSADNDSIVSSSKNEAGTMLLHSPGYVNSKSTPSFTSEHTDKSSVMSSLLNNMSKAGTMIVLNAETGYGNSCLQSTIEGNPDGHPATPDAARSKHITTDVSESNHPMGKETLSDVDPPSWSVSDQAGTLLGVSEQSNKAMHKSDISTVDSKGIINTEELRRFMKEFERKYDTDDVSSLSSIKRDVEDLIRSTLTSTIRGEYESMLQSSKQSDTEVTYTITESYTTSSKTDITLCSDQCPSLSTCVSSRSKATPTQSEGRATGVQHDNIDSHGSEQTAMDLTNTIVNTKSNMLEAGDNIVKDKDIATEVNECVQNDSVSQLNNMEERAKFESAVVSYDIMPSSEQMVETQLSLKEDTCSDALSTLEHAKDSLLSSQNDGTTTTIPLLDAETGYFNTPLLSTHGMNTYGHSTTQGEVTIQQIIHDESELSNQTCKGTLYEINTVSTSLSDSQTIKSTEESDLPSQSTDDEKCLQSIMSEQSNQLIKNEASEISGQCLKAIPGRESELKNGIGLCRLSRKTTVTDSHGTDSFHRQWIESCVDNHTKGQGLDSCSLQCKEICVDASHDCKDGCSVASLGSSVDSIRCSKHPEGVFNDSVNSSSTQSPVDCTDSCVDTGLKQCIESCVDSICSMVTSTGCINNKDLSQETHDNTFIGTPLSEANTPNRDTLDDLKAASDIEKRICLMAQEMVRRELSFRTATSKSTVSVNDGDSSLTNGLESELEHTSDEQKEKPSAALSNAIRLGSTTDEKVRTWPKTSLVKLCSPFVQRESSLFYQTSTERNSIRNSTTDKLLQIQSESQHVSCGTTVETNISRTVISKTVTSQLQNQPNKPLDDGPQAMDKYLKFVVENKKKDIIEKILREFSNSNIGIDENVPNSNITNQKAESKKQMRNGVASLQTIEHPGLNLGVQDFKHSSQIIVTLPDSPVDPFPTGVNGSGEFCYNQKETEDKSDLPETIKSTGKTLDDNHGSSSVDTFNEHTFDDEETHNSGGHNASTYSRANEIYLNEIKCDDSPSDATILASHPSEHASDTTIVDYRCDDSSSDVTIMEKPSDFEEKPIALASKNEKAGDGDGGVPHRDTPNVHEGGNKSEHLYWGMTSPNTGKYVVHKIETKIGTVALETDIKTLQNRQESDSTDSIVPPKRLPSPKRVAIPHVKSDFTNDLVPLKRQPSPHAIQYLHSMTIPHVNPKDIKTITNTTRMTGKELTPAGLARNNKSVLKTINYKTKVPLDKAALAEAEKEKRAALSKKLEKCWKKVQKPGKR